MKKINFLLFKKFLPKLHKKVLRTTKQGKKFTVLVSNDGVTYIPSSGKPRKHEDIYIKRVVDNFNKTNSFQSSDYTALTRNASYTLVLLNLYINRSYSSKKQYQQKMYRASIANEDEESTFPEGKAKYSLHRKLERNPKISKLAKQQRLQTTRTLRCDICIFSFQERYGPFGTGYIEAHHTIPVSKIKGKYKTKVSEIALVCSNCHRMLHRRRPWLTMSKLKKVLKK